MYERFPYPSYGVPSFGSLNHDLESVWFELGNRTGSLTGRSVLDIGCGTGDKTVGCAVLYPEVNIFGVDLSATSIAQARDLSAKYGLNIDFKQLDIMSIPEGTYDIIIAMGVIMLLADPVAALRKLTKCLADDGLISIYLYAREGRRRTTAIQKIITLLEDDVMAFSRRQQIGRAHV